MANVYLWDSKVKGLHTRNNKAYYFYYRAKGTGKQRRPKIGDVDQISLTEARSLAHKMLMEVLAGQDPSGERQTTRTAQTVGELFDALYASYWSQNRFKVSGHKREVICLWKNHISPHFKNMAVKECTPAIIRNWHTLKSTTPTTANRALEVLSKLLSLACEQGTITVNPCTFVKSFIEKKRSRFATANELKVLGAILEKNKEASPRQVAFIYLLIFTGIRPRALERARPNDLTTFTSENGEIYGLLSMNGKTTSSTGEVESIVIPPMAMKLLADLPKSETLLGIKTPTLFWQRIRSEAGCESLWIRDFRRTFATIGMIGGTSMDQISNALGHKSRQTTMVYARMDVAAKALAVGFIAKRAESLLKG